MDHCNENLICCLIRNKDLQINAVIMGIHINPTKRSEAWD